MFIESEPNLDTSRCHLTATAGILTIVSAVPRLAGSIFVFIFGWLGDGIFSFLWYGVPGIDRGQYPLIAIAAMLIFIASLLALLGGVYSIRGKRWGLTVAGSFCAAVLSWPVGIPALILTALSRKNFK